MQKRLLPMISLAIWLSIFASPLPAEEHTPAMTPREHFLMQLEAAPPMPAGFTHENEQWQAARTGAIADMHLDLRDPLTTGCTRELDVVYGNVDGRELKLDLYFPPEDKSDAMRPALLFLHGGGWKAGDKSIERYYCDRYAARGFVTATAQYRLSDEAHFPAQIQDVRCALRYLHANAEQLKIDPERIGVVGHSAGAHLALLAAYASPDAFPDTGGWDEASAEIRCVVSFYAPTDLTQSFGSYQHLFDAFLGPENKDDPAVQQLASPLYHISSDAPPTLVVHGAIDALIDEAQAFALIDRLCELGLPYYYDRYPGWGHGMHRLVAVNTRSEYVMDCFFEWQLGISVHATKNESTINTQQ